MVYAIATPPPSRRASFSKDKRVCDVRSDTFTEPTDDMYEMMKNASRGDDVYGEDTSTLHLETKVADLCKKQAALFCATGTMTNQIALRAALFQPPHSILCDHRSHVYLWEAGGIAYHSQAQVTPVIPKNGHHLILQDIQKAIIPPLSGLTAPTKVISLENTLNGTIMPLQDLAEISAFARQRGIWMHCDGARLWHVVAATGVPIHEWVQYFDSISLCLSKGMGAPIGSILVGGKDFIAKARDLRKLFGGGWRQSGGLAHVAEWTLSNVWPQLPATHAMATRLAEGLQAQGVRITTPVETNMVFIDTAPIGVHITDLAVYLADKGVRLGGSSPTEARLVIHYQIEPWAIDAIIDAVQALKH
ncbi:hypothetical protein BZG36_02593 [Bifiguratus adelaidae]|uniref:Aromatic amino acid beta-eliminating lyase/threonine aldolase domain-containing protein n=1 Tax=Bifiguratus adelaidae TaxID=1938954 RepID=A0A261Y134_9FUNG|nr:hypothetical protein BZG36_02593 [Bifiguratus adelaidae]